MRTLIFGTLLLVLSPAAAVAATLGDELARIVCFDEEEHQLTPFQRSQYDYTDIQGSYRTPEKWTNFVHRDASGLDGAICRRRLTENTVSSCRQASVTRDPAHRLKVSNAWTLIDCSEMQY